MDLSKRVLRAIVRSFPASQRMAAIRALKLYTESQEIERVQLAILAMANGKLSEVKRLAEAADIDYRDAIAWAEYPEEYYTGTTKQMAQRYRRLKVPVPKDLRH